MSWYARCGPRRSETAKFRSRAQLGTEKSSGGEYRDWFYSFVMHQTGSGVRRKRYAVSISDPNQHRAEYLRDFSSIEQATVAARHWIDHQLAAGRPDPIRGPIASPTPIAFLGPIASQENVGTIPPLPGSDSASVNGGQPIGPT